MARTKQQMMAAMADLYGEYRKLLDEVNDEQEAARLTGIEAQIQSDLGHAREYLDTWREYENRHALKAAIGYLDKVKDSLLDAGIDVD